MLASHARAAAFHARFTAAIDERNTAAEAFFEREAPRLADAANAMAERFRAGGRLIAFGRGPYATDAQHLSVEFVHPVIVGKRALPALDLSIAPEVWIPAVLQAADIVIGLGPPDGDANVNAIVDAARARGALTIGVPARGAEYAIPSPDADAHIHQEILELAGHALYESVHVYLEHDEHAGDVGEAAFLYPFLSSERQDTRGLSRGVAASIRIKSRDARTLRDALARECTETIAEAASAIAERVTRGGKLLAFGNGGSATDATDFALDCVTPADDGSTIPALSLALEPAILTAIANDVGRELTFMRQIIAQAGSDDVACAFSTSGGSTNVIAGLEEARRRGLVTVALLGYDGGEVVRRGLADYAIVVRSQDIPRIQEAQATVYHLLRDEIVQIMSGPA